MAKASKKRTSSKKKALRELKEVQGLLAATSLLLGNVTRIVQHLSDPVGSGPGMGGGVHVIKHLRSKA